MWISKLRPRNIKSIDPSYTAGRREIMSSRRELELQRTSSSLRAENTAHEKALSTID